MTPKEILVCARELLSDPNKWTKKTMARDATGKHVSAKDDSAVCWCMAGAIEKCDDHFTKGYAWQIRGSELSRAWDALLKVGVVSGEPIKAGVEFNDDPETTHEMLMRRFDAAIAAVEVQP